MLWTQKCEMLIRKVEV